MIVVVDLTGEDGGGEPPPRVLPCIKRTWCALHLDHEGACIEYPRRPLPPNDFGPKRKRKARA